MNEHETIGARRETATARPPRPAPARKTKPYAAVKAAAESSTGGGFEVFEVVGEALGSLLCLACECAKGCAEHACDLDV